MFGVMITLEPQVFGTTISVQNICGNIAKLKQCCINNGKYTTDSPNYSFFGSLDLHQSF